MKYEIKIIYNATNELVDTRYCEDSIEAIRFLGTMLEIDKKCYPNAFKYVIKEVK